MKKTTETADENTRQQKLLLWPAVVIVAIQWLLRFILPLIVPDALAPGIFVGLLLGPLLMVWWIFFSRAPRFDRWSALGAMAVCLTISSLLVDISIKTSMMGMMFAFFSIPVMSLAFTLWAAASPHLPQRVRRAAMFATIFAASGFWILLRTDGMSADAKLDFAWRWAPTAEELLLAKHETLPDAAAIASPVTAEAGWPGFRGANRDGIVRGVRIRTDWAKNPPVLLWRKGVGPGCSSFAVSGDLLYTQEQRGDDETVICRRVQTGETVWLHADKARFWDSHAGAGPRATPLLYGGRVYTSGATGILNALDGSTGEVIWSRNAAGDTGVKIPGWGYAGSPLADGDELFVAIAGQILAYDIATGAKLWSGPDGGESYSSAHIATIDNVRQVLFLNKRDLTSYSLPEGKVLWSTPGEGVRIIQPCIISNNDILIDTGDLKGLRRISVKKEAGEWRIENLWTTKKLRPNHNDIVVHKGFTYGIDGTSLACIDLETGNGRWKTGRFGGQILLLADQDLILLLSEAGEVVLVEASPERFREVARMPAIKGKTWNHPVLVNGVLFVRNAEEMAAFRLAPAGS